MFWDMELHMYATSFYNDGYVTSKCSKSLFRVSFIFDSFFPFFWNFQPLKLIKSLKNFQFEKKLQNFLRLSVHQEYFFNSKALIRIEVYGLKIQNFLILNLLKKSMKNKEKEIERLSSTVFEKKGEKIFLYLVNKFENFENDLS